MMNLSNKLEIATVTKDINIFNFIIKTFNHKIGYIDVISNDIVHRIPLRTVFNDDLKKDTYIPSIVACNIIKNILHKITLGYCILESVNNKNLYTLNPC